MRATSRIESLSYETIYMTGFIVALFLSFGPHSPLQRFLLHTVCSCGCVQEQLHFPTLEPLPAGSPLEQFSDQPVESAQDSVGVC